MDSLKAAGEGEVVWENLRIPKRVILGQHLALGFNPAWHGNKPYVDCETSGGLVHSYYPMIKVSNLVKTWIYENHEVPEQERRTVLSDLVRLKLGIPPNKYFSIWDDQKNLFCKFWYSSSIASIGWEGDGIMLRLRMWPHVSETLPDNAFIFLIPPRMTPSDKERLEMLLKFNLDLNELGEQELSPFDPLKLRQLDSNSLFEPAISNAATAVATTTVQPDFKATEGDEAREVKILDPKSRPRSGDSQGSPGRNKKGKLGKIMDYLRKLFGRK